MKLLVLLGLAAIVVVSGCTVPGTGIEIPGIPDFFGGGGVTAQGDVIVFKDVQAIPSVVKVEKTTKGVVNVQNVGKETKKVTVYLFDLCPDIFDINGNTKQYLDVLPNEIKQVEFTLIAKKQPVKISCSLKFSATYAGSTESTTTLSFINHQEYEKQLQSGGFRTAASQKQIGEGPLKAYIDVLDTQPVSSESTAKINLVVKNTGSGYVASTEDNVKSLLVMNAGAIKITAPGLKTIGSCAFLKDGTNVNFDIFTDAKDIKLIRKEASPMECTLEIDDKSTAGTVTKLITVKALYNYVIEKDVMVTVEP